MFFQNLQNEIHHLSDQVLKVTNAVNELREGLKEGLIEASAAKSDQILELAKAFNWLTDKLAYQSPPKLGIFFLLFYQFHWASKP